MKRLLFIIALLILSIGVFSQTKNDTVFSESEIILKTSTGDISGTLTVPCNVKTSPVVLIIAGSGPTDRNCNSSLGIKTNAYKMLAESFGEKGISTLRFDKRGIGKSKTAMIDENEATFETYIDDVVGWISLLQSDQRFSRIIVLGHSEGSLIGIIAAERTKVSALISVSGTGYPADQILQEQLKDKLSFELLDESDKIIDSLKMGKTVSNVNPNLLFIYRPAIQPYLISWMQYDPAKEISKLKIPVLIVQGTTDLQVTVDNAKMLSASKPDAELLLIDSMNHILKESDTDIQRNMATYNKPDLPLKTGLVDFILTKK